MPNAPGDIEFGRPAAYRIVVQGAVGADWSDRLAGLALTTTPCAGAAPHTTLVGTVLDQAQLAGVLDSLYEMHLPILEVEHIEDPIEDSDPEEGP